MSNKVDLTEMFTIENIEKQVVEKIDYLVEKLFADKHINHMCGQIRIGNKGSLTINDDTEWYSHEDQIGGKGPISLIRYALKCDFIEALNYAKQFLGSDYIFVKPSEKKKPHKKKTAQDKIEYAQRIWQRGKPIQDTPAQAYLISRGIVSTTSTALTKLRYISSLKHYPTGSYYPCLIAKIEGYEGEFQGILRIYLSEDGKNKAPVNPTKMILGKTRDGAIKLSKNSKHLVVAEGLEDALTLLHKRPEYSVWCLIGSNLTNFNPPAGTEIVTIAADRDSAGKFFAEKLAQRLFLEGYEVRIAYPAPNTKDFNQMLMEGHHAF